MSELNKIFLVFAFLILNNTILEAQNNFVEGFVVQNNGDTLIGKIKNRSLLKMHSICLFKLNDYDKVQEFMPRDIQSFRFNNGKYFISKVVTLNGIQKQVFLEFLINGQADLYSYKDKNGLHFFLQNQSDSLIELKNTTTEIQTNSGKYVKDNEEYIYSLKTAFKDSPEIQPEIDKTDLNDKELIAITEKYHKYVCNDYECIKYNKDVKLKISLGFNVGVIFSKINFTVVNESYKFLNNESFKYTPSFTTGILYSQKNMFGFNDNLSFNFQLEYQNNNYKSDNIEINQKSISLPIYFTYYFPTGNLRPFINFGFSNTFFISSNALVYNKIYTELWNETFSNRLNDAIGNYQISGLVGIGAEYIKNKIIFLINASYELGSGIISSGDYTNNYLTSINQGIVINIGIKRALY